MIDDKGRRQGDGIPCRSDQHAIFKAFPIDCECSFDGGIGFRRDIDTAHQAYRADIFYIRCAFQRKDGILPDGNQVLGALEQLVILVEFQGRKGGGTSERMRRPGKAMREFDSMGGQGCIHEGVIDGFADGGATERHCAVGDGFGECDDVGFEIESVGRKSRAEPTKARDDFIENQRNGIGLADSLDVL